MSDKMRHIASAVVKARPADQQIVAGRLAAIPGTEIIAVDAGRFIVLLEATNQHDISDALDHIAKLDGVLSAVLVFEHAEPKGGAE